MAENAPVVVPTFLRERFALACQRNRVLLFHAPCGCGKTVVAKELLKADKPVYMSAADNDFSLTEIDDTDGIWMIDDLHLIEDAETCHALCERIRTQKETHFVLLSRGAIPGWLMPFQLAGIMECFGIEDLLLDKNDVKTLMKAYKLSLTGGEISAIFADTKGFPVALAILLRLLSEQTPYSETAFTAARQQLYLYFDEMVYRRFDSGLRNLLLELAPFNSFDVELAQLLSGDNQAGAMLGYLQQSTSMLLPEQSGKLSFRPIFRSFLLWKLSQELTPEEQKKLYSRAGIYYELHDDMKKALDCYTMVGDHRKVSELLAKNAELHVGIGQYLDMEQYYFAMPKEEILRSPTLIAGMSMLCSLFMDFEQSDHWYSALQNYTAKLKKSDEEYRDARGRLAYLDIALPQRGSAGLTEVIRTVFRFFSEKQLKLPAFSVTSTLPSVMNGGKDFCGWSKKDDIYYATMRNPVEALMGRDGIGLADCAICESKFEKDDDYQPLLLTLLSRLTEIQRKGTPDIEFAVVGLLARVQTTQGQAEAAIQSLNMLRSRFEELGETRFFPNLDALLCRIAMRQGDMSGMNRWLREKAPKDDLRIWTLHRYQYITKTMVQIAGGDPSSALLILARLLPYTQKCGRVMDEVYLHALMAICYHRMGNELWKKEFCTALNFTCDYRFIRPIAQFGAAALPLLSGCGWKKDGAYLERLLAATRTQAVNYPLFLKPEVKLTEPLTAAEQQVLKLLCHNLSNQEICDMLGIKLATVKTHVSHILQKLGVSHRSEAKAVAEKLELV